eukprot:scaffold196694_cov31-Tisochrysis_lutea.AAC.1
MKTHAHTSYHTTDSDRRPTTTTTAASRSRPPATLELTRKWSPPALRSAAVACWPSCSGSGRPSLCARREY